MLFSKLIPAGLAAIGLALLFAWPHSTQASWTGGTLTGGAIALYATRLVRRPHLAHVGVLRPQEGDIIVYRPAEHAHLSSEDVHRVREQMRDLFPRNRCAVLSEGRLTVITAAALEEAANERRP